MRKLYHTILKAHFHTALVRTREARKLTQLQMSQLLSMDERSYIDLDHGKSSCSAITLVLFLIYVCDDAQGFLEELRNAIEAENDQAA